MGNLWRLFSEETLQYAVFLGLSAVVFILTVVIQLSNSSLFLRFFGRIPALLVVAIVFIIGLILFSFLLSDGQFAIYRRGNLTGLFLGIGLAVPFAAVMILVDKMAHFPADMNAAFPDSLAFYPAIGYVVEILFHILPFCILYFISGILVGESSNPSIIWVIILWTLDKSAAVPSTIGSAMPICARYELYAR